ncbi:branched-chain amino acid ABC transporter substrate-binding protein [Halobacteriales archaeon SW_7_71_33]|nr:MAG: branched-chain amino acid ABC transporter substrate-binding protein [Halobacteriales archaeon SW_7_71_33]
MSSDSNRSRRRDVLKAVGAASAFSLAGCTGGGGGGPDALFIVGYPEDGQQLFRDYYSTSDGSEDILVPDGLRDGALPGQVGNDMENVIGTAPAAGGPAQETFTSNFEERYGEAPGVFTAQSYDSAAVLVLANVMAGENDGTSVRDQMRNAANPGGMEVTPDNFAEGVEAAAQGEDVDYVGASSDVNFNDPGDPANAAYDVWEFDGQDSESSSILDTQSFEGDNPEGAGESADDIPGGTGRTVELGILLPTSGNLASVGQPMTQAAQMPAREVNEAGVSIEVSTSIEDTETRSNAGTEAAQRLVDQGVPGICGTASSGVNVPVSDGVLAPNQTVGCSPSSTALSVTNLGDDDYVFRTAPSDILQGRVDAQLVAERLEAGSVSTMFVDNDYGQQLSDRFVEVFTGEFDGEVVSEVGYPQGSSSYTSEIESALSGSGN